MKKTGLVLVTSATFAIALLLTVPGMNTAQTTEKFAPKQLREDFQIARQSLEEGNSGLYRYTKKADLDRIFDDAEKSLDHPMDFFEFYRVVMPIIAAIKCGHTTIDTPPEVRKVIEGFPRFPFDVKVLDSKAYVFRDYAKGGALQGKEILVINSIPASGILSTMLAAVSKDGDIQSSRQREVSNNFGENLITLG